MSIDFQIINPTRLKGEIRGKGSPKSPRKLSDTVFLLIMQCNLLYGNL